MISEEQQREYPPKETLYIQNINEKIKPKGTTALTQMSSTCCSISSKPSDRSCRSYARGAIGCAGRPSSCSGRWGRPLPPRTTSMDIRSLVSPW